jgi:hypothetical protein
MTAGLSLPLVRRRPTPGALYTAGVVAFATLVLLLTGAGLMDPVAITLIGVPLGPIGVVVAALAMPAFTGVPSPALAALVVAGTLAVAVVNVLAATLVARLASGAPILRR